MRPRRLALSTAALLCLVLLLLSFVSSNGAPVVKKSAALSEKRDRPLPSLPAGRSGAPARKEGPPPQQRPGEARAKPALASPPALSSGDASEIGDPGRVLLVSSLDGRITALSARTGRVLWSVQTGGPMVNVKTGNITAGANGEATAAAAAAAAASAAATGSSPLSEALIIPSRDGAILLRTPTGGMQQLPYRAQDLVQSLPMSAGGNILVGSKTTRAIQVNLLTGKVMRTISGGATSGSFNPLTGEQQGEGEDGEGEDAVPPPLPSGIHFGSPLKPSKKGNKKLPDGGEDADEHDGSLATPSSASPAASPTTAGGLLFGPSIWLGRSDFLVKAFSPGADQHLWNLTFAEMAEGGSSMLVVDGPPLPTRGETKRLGTQQSMSSNRQQQQHSSPSSSAVLYFEGETIVAQPPPSSNNNGRTKPPSASPPLIVRLAAHMTGELYATDATTGAFLWQSPPLYAPILQVHVLSVMKDGTATHAQPVPFAEVWPAGRAIAAGSSSGSSSASTDLTSAAAATPSDLFVGMLASGQLFALPRSPRTVLDTSADPSAYWSSVFAAIQRSKGGGRGDKAGTGQGALPASSSSLLLPAPDDGEDNGDDSLSSSSSSALVVRNDNDDATAVALAAQRAQQQQRAHADSCSVPSSSPSLSMTLQCLVGLHNVTYVGSDGKIHSGWNNNNNNNNKGARGDRIVAGLITAGGAIEDANGNGNGNDDEDLSSWGARLGLPADSNNNRRRPPFPFGSNRNRRNNPYYWDGGVEYPEDAEDYRLTGLGGDEDDNDDDDGADFDFQDGRGGRRSQQQRAQAALTSQISYPLAQWLHSLFASSSSSLSASSRRSSITRIATLLDNFLVASLSASSTILVALSIYWLCIKKPTGGANTTSSSGGAASKGKTAGGENASKSGVAKGGGRGGGGGSKAGGSGAGANNGRPQINPNAAAFSSPSATNAAGSPPSSNGSGQLSPPNSNTNGNGQPGDAAENSALALPNGNDSGNSNNNNNNNNPTTAVIEGVEYRIFGRRLAVSDRALGYGCHGTVVFRGLYDRREVAVKRLLKTFHPHVSREISLLIRTDNHPHVVRYYACEEAADFIYLALELCESTLADAMVKAASKRRAKLTALNNNKSSAGNNNKQSGTPSSDHQGSSFAALADKDDDEEGGGGEKSSKKSGKKAPGVDAATLAASLSAPVPSPATRLFLRHLVSGVAHLHSHRIVHRDLKPHNILLAKINPSNNNSGGGAGGGGASAVSASSTAGSNASSGSTPSPWWLSLYPTDLEGHQLGLHYAPKISDFGLGKQLESGDDASTVGYAGRRGPNGAPLPAGVGNDGGASSLFIQRHNAGAGAGAGGNRAGVTGGASSNAALIAATAAVGAGSSSSAVAPGSVGWQAPEVLSAVIRLRGGHLPSSLYPLGGSDSTNTSPEKGSPLPAAPDAEQHETPTATHSASEGDGEGSTPAVVSGDDEDRDAAVAAAAAAEKQGAAPQAILPTRSASSAASAVAAAVVSHDDRWRKSRSADVWALACVLYHVLDPGRHPYGESFDREANIIRGKLDLSRLDNASPEAKHLLAMMLHQDPNKRPSASMCLEHPFFWDDEKRMAFLQDFSDRVDQEPSITSLTAIAAGTTPDGSAAVSQQQRTAASNALVSSLRSAVESKAQFVFSTGNAGGLAGVSGPAIDWCRRLPQALVNDGGKYRAYDSTSLGDCLRLVRNKRNHYHALPLHIRRDLIGSEGTPAALVPFFLHPSRFPKLLLAAYEVAVERLSHEPQFAGSYLGPITSSKHALRSSQLAARLAQLMASAFGNGSSTTSSASSSAAAAASKAGNAAITASAAVSSPAPALCRGWFCPEDEWQARAAETCRLAATVTGGRVVPATIERADEASGNSKTPHGAYPGPAATRAAADAAEAAASGKVMVVAAHSTLKETDFKGGAHSFHLRYKSIPCKDFDGLKGQRCPRGVRCDFAHGPIELRVRPPPGKAAAVVMAAGAEEPAAAPAPKPLSMSFAEVAATAAALPSAPAASSAVPAGPVKPDEVLAGLSLLLDLRTSGLPPIYPPKPQQ